RSKRDWSSDVCSSDLRFEHLGIADDRSGLPERADEILSLWQIDTGFTADRRVDLSKECRGDVNHRNATVVHRGRETRGVGDDTAADGYHAITPGESPLCPVTAEVLDGAQIFSVSTSRQGEDAVVDVGIDGDRNVVRGHDRRTFDAGRQDFGETVAGPMSHQDRVGPVTERDVEFDHGR